MMYEYVVSQVVKVVDGDTLDVIIDVGFDMMCKERIRINRVDTPESKTTNELEKKLGLDAKQYVESWVEKQKQIRIKTFKDDKYGRILGELFGDSGECLNDLLIEHGYAWEYNGETKKKDFKLLLEKRNKNGHT
jgi:micrococcal nuclease